MFCVRERRIRRWKIDDSLSNEVPEEKGDPENLRVTAGGFFLYRVEASNVASFPSALRCRTIRYGMDRNCENIRTLDLEDLWFSIPASAEGHNFAKVGHSNLSTTADVYTHSADADRSAALVLEQAIFGDLFQNCSKLGTWNKNAAAN